MYTPPFLKISLGIKPLVGLLIGNPEHGGSYSEENQSKS